MIRNLVGALALFARQTRQTFTPQPRMTAHVPEFPLRCQHCEASIRPAGQFVISPHNGTPAFVDAAGFSFCCPEHRIPHRPMPSILG